MLIEGKTPQDFAQAWYQPDAIHAATQYNDEIPTDVHSREFAEWLANQCIMAMVKGMDIAEAALQPAHYMIIQSNYLIHTYAAPDGLDPERWPSNCVAIAFVWNILAQKEGMCKGESYLGLPGYAGTVWIDAEGNWNRGDTSAKQDPWNGWIPINDIVAHLKTLKPQPPATIV